MYRARRALLLTTAHRHETSLLRPHASAAIIRSNPSSDIPRNSHSQRPKRSNTLGSPPWHRGTSMDGAFSTRTKAAANSFCGSVFLRGQPPAPPPVVLPERSIQFLFTPRPFGALRSRSPQDFAVRIVRPNPLNLDDLGGLRWWLEADSNWRVAGPGADGSDAPLGRLHLAPTGPPHFLGSPSPLPLPGVQKKTGALAPIF